MNVIGQLQGWISLALSVAALAIAVWAFIDCLRHRPDAFVAAGKRTKTFWLAVTGVAMLVAFIGVGGIGGLLGIISVVAAGVYLADVRPALNQVMGRSSGGREGPYGPW